MSGRKYLEQGRRWRRFQRYTAQTVINGIQLYFIPVSTVILVIILLILVNTVFKYTVHTVSMVYCTREYVHSGVVYNAYCSLHTDTNFYNYTILPAGRKELV